MTCLMDRSLSGALIKLHTSMLGTFFVYTLAQSMPIFKKKSSRIFLGESSKLCIVVTSECGFFCPVFQIIFISGLANECPPWKRKMKNEQRGTWTRPAMALLIAVTRLSVGSIYWPARVVRIVLMLWIDIVTPMADHRRCQAIITIIIEDLLHFIQCWTGIWPSIRGLKPILRLWNGP